MTLPILCFSGSECRFVALFLPCWYCLFSALQLVDASALIAMLFPSWHCLSSVLQPVSAFALPLCFSPPDVACPLLSSLWVLQLYCFLSLILPVFCSPVGECLCLVALFLLCQHCLFSVQGCECLCSVALSIPANIAWPLPFRKSVTLLCCSVSSMLTLPVLWPPVSEWLCLVPLFIPANIACPLLSSELVFLLCSSVSSLLTLPILCFSGSEFLPCWFVSPSPCWHCLPYAIQKVSSSALLFCFSLAQIPYLLSSKWVSLLGCSVLLLLTLYNLCFSDSEFLPCWSVSPCWHCLSSAIKKVSSSALLLSLSPADIPCLLLSRKWVSLLGCSVLPLLTLYILCFSESTFLPIDLFLPADIACPLLYRK